MKTTRAFKVELRALYDGRRSFDVFAARTAPVWRGLAAYLYRRWTPPAGCTPEDVVQELLMAVWRLLPKWDRDRGALDRYVVWNACNLAKLWLHKQRGANMHGNHDAAPSRFPMAFSSMALHSDGGDSGGGLDDLAAANRFAARRLVAEPTQEQAVERRRVLERAMEHCYSPRERLALAALAAADGSVDGAADRLYDDTTARRICRLGSTAQARTVVRRTLQNLTTRVRAA